VLSYISEIIITSGQSNLTKKGCSADVHGRLSRIRQVAPMYTPSNTCLLGLCPRPHPKHLNRFSRFCTAHSSELIYFTISRPLFPLKLPLSRGSGLSWFLGPTWVHNPNCLDRFSGFCRAHDRDRQIDRQITLYSVCNNRPHLRT